MVSNVLNMDFFINDPHTSHDAPHAWCPGIPDDLDEIPPGPLLADELACIDVNRVCGYDRVVVLRAHQRMVNHFQAKVYEDMVAVCDVLADPDAMEGFDSSAAEIRAALHLTRHSADSELVFALDLDDRLSSVAAAMQAGQLDGRRAKVIDRHTSDLPDHTARRIVDMVIDEAPHLTTGELGALCARLRIEADPDEAERRYAQAVEERRVYVEPTQAGTAHLHAFDLPPDRAARIMQGLTTNAKGLRGNNETRTIDQLRADTFLDILDPEPVSVSGGASHDAAAPQTLPGGVVDIHVDLDTLAGLAQHPGDLNGYGPVIADIARRTAEQHPAASWRYTATDPATGDVIAIGTTRRRPTKAMKREIESHQRTCAFPGCRMPATQCDLDHITAWADGGPTDTSNLAPLCRHDHRIKHTASWVYAIHPDGTPRWTSGLGHTYTKRQPRGPGRWGHPDDPDP